VYNRDDLWWALYSYWDTSSYVRRYNCEALADGLVSMMKYAADGSHQEAQKGMTLFIYSLCYHGLLAIAA
jgi:hypothetical protein